MKEALRNLAPSSLFGIFSHKSIWVIHLLPTLSIPSHLLAFSSLLFPLPGKCHLSWEFSSQEVILDSSDPRGCFLQLLSVLPFIAHSFIWQTTIEHLTILGTEDPEMIKIQGPEALIWLKYAFYIEKIAVKKIPSFAKIILNISHWGKTVRKWELPVFIK